MSRPPRVSPSVFRLLAQVDVGRLASFGPRDLRPVLASLVRMSLIASLDKSSGCFYDRTAVLKELSNVEVVNNLVALLSIDFHALENEVKKEQQKISGEDAGGGGGGGSLAGSLAHGVGPALEFERSDAGRRLRLVLSDLIAIMNDLQRAKDDGGRPVHVRPSELFDHPVYLSEVCDVLCIAMAELPMLLSPPEVAEALLRLKYGPFIICHVVANQPDSFTQVVNHLMMNAEEEDNRMRFKALILLSEMNPSEMRQMRSLCLQLYKLPSLAIQLTVQICRRSNDFVELVGFLSGLLLGPNVQSRSWLSTYLRSAQKRNSDQLSELRKCLAEHLKGLVDALRQEKISSGTVIKSSALLRLYTALRGIAGMKLTEEEASLLFELITVQPPATVAGVKFVSLGLCALIACPSILSSPHLEKRIVDWLRWLLAEEKHYEIESGVDASFGEMLLLMAIHFHTHQLSQICDLVCQTLGMKMAIRTNSMNKMKTIFTQDVFTENVVAAHAVRVPVTKNLSANTEGFLPVHCIHQLLKSRAFSKHKVPIKDWIYRQVVASSTPIHPVLMALIEVYVNSILVPASNKMSRGAVFVEQTNEPFTESEIKAIFKQPVFDRTSNVAPHMITLYYILLYENVRLQHMRTILSAQRKVHRYSGNGELLANIPIKFLLRTAEKNGNDYGSLYPALIRLAAVQYPHLCMVQDWLRDTNDNQQPATSSVKSLTECEVKTAFSEVQSSSLTLVIQRLLSLKPKELWQFVDIIVSPIRKLLDASIPRQIIDLYRRLWFELNQIFPRQLWAKTTNALAPSATDLCPSQLSQEDLTLDPLTVLRCDKRVFRCGPLLEIVTYMLKASMAASRTHLTEHILHNPMMERVGQVSSEVEREELKNALIATQESAALQILLESCLPSPEEEKERSLLTNLKEVQSIVCLCLHEAFISDPNMAKLVHFQGYPLDLLPMTVAGVPSMHICLDFVPELLSQPELDKQIFAIDLISHLSIQYALPKSFSIARLAVNSLYTLLSVLSVEERKKMFPPALPALVRFSRAFPPLVEDIVNLLVQYAKICQSQACMRGYTVPKLFSTAADDDEVESIKARAQAAIDSLPSMGDPHVELVKRTFAQVVKEAIVINGVF